MTISDDLASIHSSAMDDFGQDVLYTPTGGSAVTKRGLIETGVQPERVVPGIYAQATFQASDFASAPQEGDEITLVDGIYKVMRIRSVDGGTGTEEARIHRLLLRRARDVGEGS